MKTSDYMGGFGDDIKNPYMYKKMLDVLNKASDEKYRSISIQTFKFLAGRVEFLSAKYGVKYWDKTEDTLMLSKIIKNLENQLDYVPEDKKMLANRIYHNILKIQEFEEGEKSDNNVYEIKKYIDFVLRDLNKM